VSCARRAAGLELGRTTIGTMTSVCCASPAYLRSMESRARLRSCPPTMRQLCFESHRTNIGLGIRAIRAEVQLTLDGVLAVLRSRCLSRRGLMSLDREVANYLARPYLSRDSCRCSLTGRRSKSYFGEYPQKPSLSAKCASSSIGSVS